MSIHIYVSIKNFFSVLKSIRIDGLICVFHEPDEPVQPEKNNVFILDAMPEKIYSNAKYILCSDNPNALTTSQLEKLFDVWPLDMTPELLKFYFKKIIACIKSQLQSTTEELEHQKRIIEMARQDYLTGLATRWYLNEYIENNKDEENITCIYFDLDNFKKVNDTYGHGAGDRALAATAEMMQEEFSDGFCARMGGDEFMIVIPGMIQAQEVRGRVDDFMEKLCEFYSGVESMKTLSVSAGIAQKFRGMEKSIDQLIHESDQALYAAKKNGRAQSEIYRPSMN